MLGLLLVFSAVQSARPPAAQRKYNFNQQWLLHTGDLPEAQEPDFKDSEWKPVTLPAAWNEDEAFLKDIVDLSTGIVWYRKHFKLPAGARGKKVIIEFEGIRQAGDFYVNGHKAGFHEDGVTAFGFDITDYLYDDGRENVIAARIDNSWDYRERATQTKYQWEDRNFNANYGGIIRNVYLHLLPRLYQTLPLYADLQTTGVYIYADHFDIAARTAHIHARSEVRNETTKPQQITYQVDIVQPDGKLLQSFQGKPVWIRPGETAYCKADNPVQGLQFWSWGYGYLYDVKTSLLVDGVCVDQVVTRTGFRKTEFKKGMIWLNDRVIMIHGYAQRSSNEWPALGTSVPAWMSDYSNGLMVKSGGNLVRWMHITPSKQDVESCDRVGLMQAMPAGDAEKDVEGTRWEQRVKVMRAAIIYNRNNPSIIFYECGNESISEAHMREMKAIRDQYDPSGGRAIGSREMLDSKEAEYGGEMLYTNKSAHIPMWAMEYSRDEGSRKYWDEWTPPFHKDGDGPLHKGQSAASYNRNMESHALENVRRWYEFWRERPGTGERVSSGGVNIVWSETNTHHRGEENYRRSGEVDALRIKKQNYYAHKVMWDGWVVPERFHAHILGHWNYQPGTVKDIYVIAAADSVVLQVNGRFSGAARPTDGFIFRFRDIAWQAGTIAAIGFDKNGKQICQDQIETVGAPVALRLRQVPRPEPFRADGHDISLVEIEVVDAQGRRCPTALDMIDYQLEGPGEWRGGMAMGPQNYIGAKRFPVEGGVNRFMIRSGLQPGIITVRAKAPGLQPATIRLETTAFPVQDGLALQLPGQSLPVQLDRGPTPDSVSFRPTRRAIHVRSAKAGAHQEQVKASYDDNELSDWANDGQLRTAWVEYEFGAETQVDEIVLKLNNFRSRSYPLRITMDGRLLFEGSTATSLGYCTIPCQPGKGRRLRIQLTGAPHSGNASREREVNGQQLAEGVTRRDPNARGQLSIIEAEFYYLL
ncbi:DUF4982 domain-containing protein [Niabella terrae]